MKIGNWPFADGPFYSYLSEHCWVSAQSKDDNYKDRNSNQSEVVRRRSNTSRPNKRRQTEESGKIFQFKNQVRNITIEIQLYYLPIS